MSMLEILLTVLVVNVCTTLVRTEVCLSDECRITSEYIQNNINMSADPCVDWYNFACGGWLKQNDIPADVYKWSPIVEVGKKIEKQLIDILDDKSWEFKHRNSTAVRKIKHLYWSCKDFSTTQSKKSEPLRKLIDEYGSWTVAPSNTSWSRRDWTLQEALQRAHNLTGTSFFSIDVHVDQKNSSRNIIYFYQSGLTFKRRTSEYSDTTLRNDFMTAGTTVGLNLGGCNETVRIKMYQVYQLERALARIFISDEYAKDLNNLYNPMNLTEFQRMLGNWIDIEEYMNAIFGPGVITADEQIIVQTPTYFRQLGDIILLTDTEVLANYIMWNLVLPTMGYLSSDFYKADVELQSQFGTKINAQQSKSYTWSVQCFMESKKIMPFVSSALFVDRHYSQEFNIKVATAMDNIEHAFINNLDQLSWIDEETKINLTEKARALTNLVGYPDWILDPCKLDAKYEDLVIEEGEFFQNFLYYTKFEKDNSKRQLRHPPDRKKWYMYPHDGMAYYFPIGNQMGIMAGLLQEPIISQYYPSSYLYGSLGGILAHELIHAFDNRGRLFDQHGNLRDSWTPHVAEEFTRRSQCFIDQYNGYEVFDGFNISGSLTLGENIADNGGMKIAFKAYKCVGTNGITLPGLNLTDDQLFFVGMSKPFCAKYETWFAVLSSFDDVHCNERYRVIGSVSNSRDFAAAFNCPLNSPMNPERKCDIW